MKKGAADYNDIGASYLQQGNFIKALKAFKKAYKRDPINPIICYNIGNLYKTQNNVEEAIRYFKRAIALDSTLAPPYKNIGHVLLQKGDVSKAKEMLLKGIELDPYDSLTLNNIGLVYEKQKKADKAIKYYKKALVLNPSLVKTRDNLAFLYTYKGEIEKALMHYKKALEYEPYNRKILGYLIFYLKTICKWDEINMYADKLNTMFRNKEHGNEQQSNDEEEPLNNVGRSQDVSQNLQVAQNWSKCYISPSIKQFRHTVRNNKNKINIGYISNDFLSHATMHLVGNLFKIHDRKRFNIYTYSYGVKDTSTYRKDVEKISDFFVDIFDFTDKEAAQEIYDDAIDILIDMKGHTAGSRLGILSYKPAPIQVTWLGFPGTTGTQFVDYIIADQIVIPEKDSKYYSEHVVYMPHTYQVNSRKQLINAKKPHRKQYGLSKDAIIYACFNQPYKIEEELFNVWMKILKSVPGSVLWLMKTNEIVEKQLTYEAKKRGISDKRIVFADVVSNKEHMVRLSLADIALDTLTYNGHTTTSDALWVGVPVITLKGSHFASRVSAGLLNAINLPECITCSLDEYKERAISLGKDKNKLRELKEKLKKNKDTTPLFNPFLFACNLEKAYEEMWKIYVSEKQPRKIIVKASDK